MVPAWDLLIHVICLHLNLQSCLILVQNIGNVHIHFSPSLKYVALKIAIFCNAIALFPSEFIKETTQTWDQAKRNSDSRGQTYLSVNLILLERI